ncbi:MAG: CinA family protein [Pseudazoarcus pumilus]|nr:CinA family protein [Pseudazoarcus pumilus]
MSGRDAALETLASEVGAWLRKRGWMLTTAESCTGGWIATAVTEIAGSSEWFDRGFVTYSNSAKQDMLGVQANTLVEHGAVSEATVREMASGALAASRARVAVAVSGIAGPGGATPGKPVGTVCFAWAVAGRVISETLHFSGDRRAVRLQTVQHALAMLAQRAESLED